MKINSMGMDYDQLKISMDNFIGQMMSLLENTDDRNYFVAALLDYVLSVSLDKDGSRDLHASRPLYKAIKLLNTERINTLNKLEPSKKVLKQIDFYNEFNSYIDDYLKKIN